MKKIHGGTNRLYPASVLDGYPGRRDLTAAGCITGYVLYLEEEIRWLGVPELHKMAPAGGGKCPAKEVGGKPESG